MNKKLVKQYADKVIALETIMEDPNASQEDKDATLAKMDNLCKLIMALPNGMDMLFAIDDIVTKHFDNN